MKIYGETLRWRTVVLWRWRCGMREVCEICKGWRLDPSCEKKAEEGSKEIESSENLNVNDK